MAKIDLTNVLVSVFKISSTYMGRLGEIQFSIPPPSLDLDYFDARIKKFSLRIILRKS